MGSRYETNVFLQPGLIRDILALPAPAWAESLRGKRLFFVGTGSSYHVAQIAKWLWRGHVSPRAEAVGSFDFVRVSQDVGPGDAVLLFSHSGSKSFTTEAAAAAHRAGATTIGLTCQSSPWKEHLSYRQETCEKEDVGVHSKSLTSALAWIVKAIADPKLSADFAAAAACLEKEKGSPFPPVAAGADVILLGDAVREWIGREITLKIQESAYLRARPFGIEEFLHGPRLSAGPGSLVVCFSEKAEKRWESVFNYLRGIEVPYVVVEAPPNLGNAGWLSQLYWGQRFSLDIGRQLGIDPDSMRNHEPRYDQARNALEGG